MVYDIKKSYNDAVNGVKKADCLRF